MAVRYAPHNVVDLWAELRHHEIGWVTQILSAGTRSLSLYLCIGLVGAGILTSLMGIGFCLIPIGIPFIIYRMLGRKKVLIGEQDQKSLTFEHAIRSAMREAL